MPKKIEKPEEPKDSYSPKGEELEIKTYLEKRIPVLKDSKKHILGNLNFEEIMKEADREYQPRFLGEKGRKNFIFGEDEVRGLRGSRAVPITGKEGEEWRSNVSEPLLMVKIQTALSILVNQNPEAVFKAITPKYKESTKISYSLWKRSWNVGRAKHQLKLFVFDLAKYGWAIGHTYPRQVKRKGDILVELDLDNPEKNKYKERDIIEFNDIFREKLDPYRTWIDDMTNLTDPWSMDDWYYEKDYSLDSFNREFGQYANADLVKAGRARSPSEDEDGASDAETNKRDDIVTVGFYESKNKDLYGIWIPTQKILLYFSPLPNDKKRLSCWHTYWNERDPRTPYGIGLYEQIKHNKVLYDRLMNMSIDQLVMAIYPMLFYSGANSLTGSGDMVISPGVIKQKLPGTDIEQIKIDYDNRGIDATRYLAERMDEASGITPTLQGEIAGKTLGETLHAKDAALKRLNIPLANIAQALEDEAYISLSWMEQVYSTPEVLEFETVEDLLEYAQENDREPVNTREEIDETTGVTRKVIADFLPVLELGLDEDREGNLIESPEDRFFRMGLDMKTTDIKWEGRIAVEPQSIISPSIELERQRKMELYNLVSPTVQLMAQAMMSGQPQLALALYKPTEQVLESQDETPENWLPDDVVKLAKDPEARAQMLNPLFVQGQTPPGAEGMPEEGVPAAGDTVIPRDEITNPGRESLEQVGNFSAGAPVV
jgi:hypothetical protein